MRDEMLKFWNEDDLEKAKWKIVNPNVWEREIPVHVDLITSHPMVEDMLAKEGDLIALEIGCGIGRLVKPISDYFSFTIGLDISDKMLEHGREYLKDCEGVATFKIGDDNTFSSVGDGTVDFIYSLMVFQHIPSMRIIDSYIEECKRVLKPGGVLRIQTHRGTPNPEGSFCGFAGQMFPSVEAFADKFSQYGFIDVDEEDGLGHPEWLWVTARHPYTKP